MGLPGFTELLMIIVVVFLLFGAGRIPGIMENLAKGVTAFKKGLNDSSADEKKSIKPLAEKDDAANG